MRLPPRSAMGVILQIDRLLREIRPEPKNTIARQLHDTALMMKRRSFVVVISDFFAEVEDIMAGLARDAVRHGARLLVNQTNDAWYDGTCGPVQHMTHCVFRCVENRVPALRCANTGVTCAVKRVEVVDEGTSQPVASGLLVICLGQGTKVSAYLLDADKVYEATIALGVATDTLDAEGGTDRVELLGDVDLSPVDVDGQGAAVTEHGALEAIFQSWQLLIPVELGVRHQASVIVDKGEQEGLPLFVRVGRVGQVGAVQGVPLPQIAKSVSFKATVRFGLLFGSQLGGGRAPFGQLAAQGSFRQLCFGDGIAAVHL